MRSRAHVTAPLGELIVAVYDEAAHYSADPREVSRLATRAVVRMVRRSRKALLHPPRPALRTRGGSTGAEGKLDGKTRITSRDDDVLANIKE